MLFYLFILIYLQIACSLVILSPVIETLPHTAANFGWYYGNSSIMGNLVESLPLDACSPLTLSAENKIVIAKRGGSPPCSFEEKVKNVVILGIASCLD